ncbi:MAG: serine/threonine protein kinase with repeat [Bacteroidetes bacterium]|nr:serine/threonine protein kinase with repeat [Bacteroidota bacterium]
MIGQSISHYKILEKLGEGGMGVVYKAQDLKLDRLVALKFLPPNITPTEAEKQRFIHEAKAASSLDHPNICTVYEIDETPDGQMFLAMAFYEGAPLSEKIKQEPLKIDEAIETAIQAAEGLQAAHKKGITHRDIKSSNVMVTPEGQVKIMDFGLAKTTGATMLTKSGATVGTVPYMSPEQARGEKVDHRTDIWSLGVVMYEMIAGRLPFQSPYSEAIVYSILNEEPKPFSLVRSDVPTELESIVKRCLQKNPAERYQRVEELIVDLRREKAELGKETPREKVPKPTKFQWRNWYLIGGAALVVAVLLIVFLPRFKTLDEGIIESTKTDLSLTWQNSIAVLPFKNISADKEQEYFCDGMTEQLITNLTNLPNVKVIARTSVMQFKNSDKTVQQIAQQLGVAHVLEGSVRKAGNKIRVTAQLIKADDGFHLWAKDYDRQLKDIFTVQDDVSNAIVQALKVKLYDLYLRGTFFLHKSDEASLNRALEYFQKSIEKDRSYALPYAGIANAYVYLADAYLPPKDAYPKAKSSALKALELDSTIAEARAALAYILGAYERDQLSSQREFRRAMEFNPNSVDLLQLSAAYLGARMGSAEAIAQADRAIALDPLNPSASWTKGKVLYDARQYDEVIEQHKRTVELDPNFFYSDSWVSLAYREKGMLKEALDEYMKVQKLMPKQPLFGLAILYARMGRQQEAKNILRDIINESTKRYIAPTGIAMVYISLGEKNLAFKWLDRAYEAHDPFLDALKTDVRYDPIHSDPRYAVLLKKMGLEK